MKTALSETFAFIKRRPAQGPGHAQRSAAALNVRPVEQISAHQAPDPVRYGDTPARPARMPIVTFLNIAGYKAVMSDDFWLSILARKQHASTLHGPTGGYGERSNVYKPAADAYGNLILMYPQDPVGARQSNPFLR
jgi:hypothetical protein